MNDPLFDILKSTFGTEIAIARFFGTVRAAHWKHHVPENIALLCHLIPDIPYTFDPIRYGRDVKGLKLVLVKPHPTTNPEVTTNDQDVYSKAA
ncbi:hypothetical protein [Grimontia marina]|uniref:Uncharacterized protein n=1 Tax=Grimontia marina TaxID=646534 RepID=A0A128EYM5_9GAMM|nr:hypothetical protein [Grimontia marina]CZF79668.1 hypothetical protein GMA8713_01074 [Grimontia marina]